MYAGSIIINMCIYYIYMHNNYPNYMFNNTKMGVGCQSSMN